MAGPRSPGRGKLKVERPSYSGGDNLASAHETARKLEVVDPAHRITLAWVLRESVTNIVRHSGARRVEIAWGPTWLEVADDGRGLRGRKEGSGLTGLRERVAHAGGRLDVGDGLPGSSGPGTRVRVELP